MDALHYTERPEQRQSDLAVLAAVLLNEFDAAKPVAVSRRLSIVRKTKFHIRSDCAKRPLGQCLVPWCLSVDLLESCV